MIETMPTLVVFGLDPEGRPRAARFAEPDAALAVKAASLLGYRAVHISDAEIFDALPDGNVFAAAAALSGASAGPSSTSSPRSRARTRTRMPARRLRKRGCDEG